jgi:hypothetical protein
MLHLQAEGALIAVRIMTLPKAFLSELLQRLPETEPEGIHAAAQLALYRDLSLSRPIAERHGLAWTGWHEAPALHEYYSAIWPPKGLSARIGADSHDMDPSAPPTQQERLTLASLFDAIPQGHVLATLGAVETGRVGYVLDDPPEDFSPDQLLVHVIDLSELLLEKLVDKVTCAGQEMTPLLEDSTPRGYLEPTFFPTPGRPYYLEDVVNDAVAGAIDW